MNRAELKRAKEEFWQSQRTELDDMYKAGWAGVRTANALQIAGIKTLEAVTQLTAEDFLQLTGVGKKCLVYLKRHLEAKGLALKGEVKNEQGGVLLILLLASGFVCVCFFALVLFVSVFIVGRGAADAAGVTGGSTKAATWNQDNSNQSSSDGSVDLRQGGLKCVQLPGVKGTPAIDRRIYPWLMAANQDISSAGMQKLTYNWLFRSNAQQAGVKSTYGPKAPVNSSYHEAGAAVDVNGMTVRKDRFQIVSIFQSHKAVWLGGGARPDPPHFQWTFDVLGEPSKYQMIRRAQEAYQRGDIDGNCLGGNLN